MRSLLYCVLRADDGARAFCPAGVDGHEVRLIGDEALVAALSHVPDCCAVPSVARAMAYARVVDALFREARAVLPLRYGCVLATEAQVLGLLRERRAEFLTTLDELAGCVEMGIRVLLTGAREPVANGAPGECEEPSGRAYLRDRRAFYAARDSGEQVAAAVAQSLGRAFAGLFVRSRAEHAVASRAGLLPVHFLVRRSDVALFRQAFARLEEGRAEKMLLTGPWPPYNFAECELPARERRERRRDEPPAGLWHDRHRRHAKATPLDTARRSPSHVPIPSSKAR